MKPGIQTTLLLILLTGCSDPVTNEPLDQALDTLILFDCDGAEAAFRFVGPDTIELTHDGAVRIMPRERSASGARYVGDGAEFWQKGDEALLIIAEQKTSCRRTDTASH